MLSEESISRIDLLYAVARMNDSALSLSDLHVLLRTESTVADLEDAFSSLPSLRARYQLRSGYVLEKGRESVVPAELAKKTRALRNIMIAVNCAKLLKRSGSTVVAVSGSTSYESARISDDLDFFCVTPKDSAWIFITKALLLQRAEKVLGKEPQSVCLSCVMDLSYARRAFTREQDALFARDALNAIVLEGVASYSDLLHRAGWMGSYFPHLYGIRSQSYSESGPPKSSVFTRILNTLLYQTVGYYIKVKSVMVNRKLSRLRDRSRFFVARVGKDHCIYESERYKRMREVYSRIN